MIKDSAWRNTWFCLEGLGTDQLSCMINTKPVEQTVNALGKAEHRYFPKLLTSMQLQVITTPDYQPKHKQQRASRPHATARYPSFPRNNLPASSQMGVVRWTVLMWSSSSASSRAQKLEPRRFGCGCVGGVARRWNIFRSEQLVCDGRLDGGKEFGFFVFFYA